MSNSRSTFTGRIGFVFAAAAAAVGLGNIWRFPYLAAKYGGLFLIIYIILTITLGYTIMVSEIAIGRKTGLSVIGAYKKLNKKYSFIGWISALTPFLVLSYYFVIGGWVMKYLFVSFTGNLSNTLEYGYFENFISGTGEPLFWFFLFLIITTAIIMFGVQKGIERISKILMPALIILSFVVMIFVVTREGAAEGIAYFLMPDFENFSLNTIFAALGQMFYSLSLAMGLMVTFGSYMKKDVDIEKSVSQIEIFDTGIAVLSGLMIIPAVFVFSKGDTSSLNAGPSLMFITMPKVFNEMWMGQVLCALFFLLVFFAAITSSVALMETAASIIHDKFNIKRKSVCIILALLLLLLGIPCSLGYGIWDNVKIMGMTILDFIDFVTNSIVMPAVALLTCIFVAYIIKPGTVIDEIEKSSKFKRKKMFCIVIKYIAPVCILIVLVTSILNAFNIIKL